MVLLNFVICERFHFHNIHTENILFGRPLSVGRSEMLDVQNFNISKPPYIAEVRRGSYPVGGQRKPLPLISLLAFPGEDISWRLESFSF